MGGDDGAREALASLNEVWIANVNGTGQLVVMGPREASNVCSPRTKSSGGVARHPWRRGAFHSPLMAHAQEELDEALANVIGARPR